jgi:arabinogalactan oligomer/maltooligosaccharide transport system permease protein
VCLGVIDAMAIYAILVLLTKDSVVIAAVVALGILAINVVYLKPGLLPAKYLTPGLVFLFVFQIFVVLYCIYIAFTNYGSGHVSTKDDAVNALLIQNQQRVEDSAAYPLSVLEKDGALFFLVTTPDGTAEIGGADRRSRRHRMPSSPAAAPAPSRLHHARTSLSSWPTRRRSRDGGAVLHDPNDGTLQTRDGSTAYQYVSTLVWDAAAGTMTNTQTGVVYHDNGNGSFASQTGRPSPRDGRCGSASTTSSARSPPSRSAARSSPCSVDVRVRHPLGGDDRPRPVPRDRVQRSADEEQEVLPGHHDPAVRLPAFLSALVWQGMFNQDFGFINQSSSAVRRSPGCRIPGWPSCRS